MGHVRIASHFDSRPEQVFDLVADADRIPEWHASIVEVKDASGPLDVVGSSYAGVMKVAGRRLEGRWEVTKVERPRFMEQRGTTPGGGSMTVLMGCAPSAGGCDVTFEVEYVLPGGFVGGLADKLFVERAIGRDLEHSVDNVRTIVESGATVRP